MKHTWSITFLLLFLFLATQLVGLLIVSQYIEYKTVVRDGEETVEQTLHTLPYGIERPALEKETSFLPIIVMVLVATGLVLLLIKFRLFLFWKFWFFISVLFCLVLAFGAFFSEISALILAVVFTSLKIFQRNVYIHNFTELFIYGGLAALFVPLFSVFSVSMLLVLISLYDIIAVRKTQHMVVMAKFQSASRLFAGLFVPYGKGQTAVLGGGDIAFPLIFTAVLFRTYSVGAFLVTGTVTLALAYLLLRSERNKFYPAMPYLSIGCFVGYGLLFLTQLL